MIYTVRRFSDDEEKKGSGLGKKLLIGAGLAAGAFGAAKTGMLGASAMKGANQLWAKGGSALGSMGMTRAGASMVKSGATGVQKATSMQNLKQATKGLEGGVKAATGEMRRTAVLEGQAAGNAVLDKNKDLLAKAQELATKK